jgi:hypothetical protein
MHAPKLCSVAVLIALVATNATAQSNLHSRLRPVTSTVRDAGVYHFGLGTWTRHTDTANGINNDVIYANTCPTGYYTALFTNEYVADEGRTPGPNAPVHCDAGLLSENSGCNCSATICGFQIAYCSGLPGFGVVSVNIGFQSAYTACAVPNPLPGAPGTFALSGLPGAGVRIQNCWVVTIDLNATSQQFSLGSDGPSCTWIASGDSVTNHLFGWTFQNKTAVTGTGTSYVGPLVAGNGGAVGFYPTPECSQVDGIRWDTLTCTGQGGGALKWPNNLTEDGWGMSTQDTFRDDTTNVTGGPLGPPSGPGCYFFGGNPFGSFHLRLFANTRCCPPGPGVCGGPGGPECRPQVDFTTPNCPCAGPPPNNPTAAGAGCDALTNPGPTQTGGATLSLAGTGSLSGTMPGINTLQLTVFGLPSNANESSYLIAGPTFLAAPQTFGQGLRCVAGALKRLQIHNANPSTSTWPHAGDFAPTIQARHAQLGDPLSPGSIRHYFVQYRASLFEPGCALPANFNCSDAHMVTWTP